MLLGKYLPLLRRVIEGSVFSLPMDPSPTSRFASLAPPAAFSLTRYTPSVLEWLVEFDLRKIGKISWYCSTLKVKKVNLDVGRF